MTFEESIEQAVKLLKEDPEFITASEALKRWDELDDTEFRNAQKEIFLEMMKRLAEKLDLVLEGEDK